MDVLPREPLAIVAAGQKVLNGLAGLPLIVVHLGTIKAAVADAKGPVNCLLRFVTRHHVEPKLQTWHRCAVWELWSVSVGVWLGTDMCVW